MVPVSAAEIIARLQAGEDLAAIAADSVPDDVGAAVRHAAPLRWLDPAIWAEVVLPRAGVTVPLDSLVGRKLAEPVALEPGRVVLRDDVRAAHLARWDPDALQQYSRELVAYFETRDLAQEVLYHRLLADRDGAVVYFEGHLEQALDEFELRLAQDLLDVFDLPDRRTLVDTPLRELLARDRAQVTTRAAWAEHFYRSAGFLERPRYTQVLDDLARGIGSRVVQLVAPGGTGKTMLLRWWIARRCIPAGILVSRVDFDDVDPVAATQHPWLILLALAHQLNGQLATRPFEELLDERRGLLPALYRGAGRETSAAVRELSTLDVDMVREETRQRFAAALASLPLTTTVVVVVDTLEVALLRSDLDLNPLISDFGRLLDRSSRIRVAFAGRYDVTTWPTVAASMRGLPVTTLTLEAFTEAEARAYLTGIQGIDRTDLVDAVVAKGDLLPFVLALYADLARQYEGLTADEIAAYDDPRLLYLIERVLERIDDTAVRYLLRYGVVARQFDRRFLDEVMRPFVEAARAGHPLHDEPASTEHPRLAATFAVAAPRDESLDVDALWERLGTYVANQSWVSMAEGSGEYVSFHPDVRQPMRLVLEQQPVFRVLNSRAAAYFRRVMAEEPARWTRWAEEVAYHLFQADGPLADAEWEGLLDEAQATGGPALRAEVAARLVGDRDLVAADGQHPAAWFRDQPVMSVDTLARAHLQVVLGRLAQRTTATTWAEVQEHRASITAMEAEAGRPLVAPDVAAAVDVALAVHASVAGRVAAAADDLVAGVEATDDPAVLAVLIEAALEHPDRIGGRGLRRIDERLAVRWSRGTDPSFTDRLGLLLAELHLGAGDLVGAEERIDGGPEAGAETALLHGRLLIARGDLDVGAQHLFTVGRQVVSAPDTAAGVDFLGLRSLYAAARAWLEAGRPDRAESVVAALEAGAPAEPDSVQFSAARRALVDDVAGRRAICLGHLREGMALLETSGQYWVQSGDRLRAAQTETDSVSVLLDHGRVREAADRLRRLAGQSVPVEHELSVTIRLVRARALDRSGDAVGAADTLDRVLEELVAREAGPAPLAQAASEGLTFTHPVGDGERRLATLASAVGAFRPAWCALGSLDALTRARPLPDAQASSSVVEPLVALLESGARHSHASPLDDVGRLLRLTDLARVLGRPRDAAHHLHDAAELVATRLADTPSLAPLRVLRAGARLGQPLPYGDEMRGLSLRYFAKHPALAVDTLTAWSAVVDPSRWATHARTTLDELYSLLQHLSEPTYRNAAAMALRIRAVRDGLLEEPVEELLDVQGRLLDELGDVAATHGSEHSDREASGAPPAAPGLEILLDEVPDGVTAAWNEHRPHQAPTGLGALTSRSWLLEDRWEVGGTTRLVGCLSEETDRAIGDLGTILRPPAAAAVLDLHLRAKTPRLAELPWELAWPAPERGALLFRGYHDGGSRQRVRRAQLALGDRGFECIPDGIVGPETRGATGRFQSWARLPITGDLDGPTESALALPAEQQRARVLVLKRSHDVQLSKSRGHLRGGELERVYRRFDADVEVLENPTQKHLLRSWHRADVVHVEASFESLSTSAGLVFGSGVLVRGESEYGMETLGVTAVDGLLDQVRRGLGPIVVLEVTAPSHSWEAARQLLLRNTFAHQLYGLGTAVAVLAIGPLTDPYDVDLVRDLVPRALVGADPGIRDLRDLWERLASVPVEQRDAVGTLAAAALFVEDPVTVPLLRSGSDGQR